jgi:hypothetical protein
MLLFELVNTEDSLTVKLLIGPGPAEIRQKLFDTAHAEKPLFNSIAKFYPQWNTIFTHKLLSRKAYDLPDEEFTAELEKQWKRFVEKELQELVSVLEKENWVHPPVGNVVP